MAQDADRPAVSRVADRGAAAPVTAGTAGVAGPAGPADASASYLASILLALLVVTVNTCQQVGGSIGTALLNTIAASALASYLLVHGHSPAATAGAAVHSYVVAFWVSAGIFAGAAVVCGLVPRPDVLTRQVADVSQAAATVPA